VVVEKNVGIAERFFDNHYKRSPASASAAGPSIQKKVGGDNPCPKKFTAGYEHTICRPTYRKIFRPGPKSLF
jgi:hypothetical protein